MIRTISGAFVEMLFWVDEDRGTAGALISDGLTPWAAEYSLSELRADGGVQAILQAAQVRIANGRLHKQRVTRLPGPA